MADEKKESEKLDAILTHLKDSAEKIDAFGKRMDCMESTYGDSMKRIDAACSRMDSFEKKGDEEEEEKKKADAAKIDAAKKDAAEAEDKAKKDAAEEEEKKKADAAKADSASGKAIADLTAKLDAALKQIPAVHAESDRVKFVAAQMAAEPIYQAFGDANGAPAPINGESLMAYQRRLASKYKEHSKAWKGVDLSTINEASVMDIAATQIYADSAEAARTPASVGVGKLREVITRDRTGRPISSFVGDPKACWDEYTQVPFRVTGWNAIAPKHPTH